VTCNGAFSGHTAWEYHASLKGGSTPCSISDSLMLLQPQTSLYNPSRLALLVPCGLLVTRGGVCNQENHQVRYCQRPAQGQYISSTWYTCADPNIVTHTYAAAVHTPVDSQSRCTAPLKGDMAGSCL
jgi:hypothetical protein